MQSFLVIDFTIQPVEGGRDILLALLDDAGYDSFEETDTGLKAYILEEDFDEGALESMPVLSNPNFSISYTIDKLENKNWNEEWETNYQPIEVEGQLYIKAPFHPDRPVYPYCIEIMPRMSFGTGHHQTTRLMCRLLLTVDIKNKTVLDMGTGTGILAIFASLLGAKTVDAIDNFEWAVENTEDNARRNGCSNVKAELGDAGLLQDRTYDVVLANINRNVLLEDMKIYVQTLPNSGYLALSGFFAEDLNVIDQKARSLGMEREYEFGEDRWRACLYRKSRIT